MKFVRTNVQVARTTKPVLTDAAGAYIAEKYTMLRSDDEKKNERERVRIIFVFTNFAIHLHVI